MEHPVAQAPKSKLITLPNVQTYLRLQAKLPGFAEYLVPHLQKLAYTSLESSRIDVVRCREEAYLQGKRLDEVYNKHWVQAHILSGSLRFSHLCGLYVWDPREFEACYGPVILMAMASAYRSKLGNLWVPCLYLSGPKGSRSLVLTALAADQIIDVRHTVGALIQEVPPQQ